MSKDSAHTVLVDFDGTLAPFTWPSPPGDPYPGVVEALNRLKGAGFQVIIFTARAWKGWAQEVSPEFFVSQLKEMQDWLLKWNIPYDMITNEKRPALWTLDDRAITIIPNTDWNDLADFIIEGAEAGGYGKIHGPGQ